MIAVILTWLLSVFPRSRCVQDGSEA